MVYLCGFTVVTNAKAYMETVAQKGDQVGISAITPAEIVYLIEKRKIAVETLTQLASEFDNPRSMFIEIPLSLTITRALSRVPRDEIPDFPDRIIAATAVHLKVPVVSRDEKIRLSSVITIW